MKCDRCGKETCGRIMSMFNRENICMECKETEKKHPKYDEAVKRVMEEKEKKNHDYEGIGLPEELKTWKNKFNDEITGILEGMMDEVSNLGGMGIERVDAIWDRNYDSIVTSIDAETEEENHEKIAEIRNEFYEGAEEYSYTCDWCDEIFYGEKFMFQGETHCENCWNEHRDEFHDA